MCTVIGEFVTLGLIFDKNWMSYTWNKLDVIHMKQAGCHTHKTTWMSYTWNKLDVIHMKQAGCHTHGTTWMSYTWNNIDVIHMKQPGCHTHETTWMSYTWNNLDVSDLIWPVLAQEPLGSSNFKYIFVYMELFVLNNYILM